MDVADGLRRGTNFVAGYVHAGACEHRLSVTDVRLAHGTDVLSWDAYPLEVRSCWPTRRVCDCCFVTPAVKVSHQDRHAPDAPAFWCAECFQRLHCMPDGTLRGIQDGLVSFPYYPE